MREQRPINKASNYEGSLELLETLLHMQGKRVLVIFDDSTRRIAKITKLIGHELKIGANGDRFVLDSIELDGDSGDLADLRRIVRIDVLKENE